MNRDLPLHPNLIIFILPTHIQDLDLLYVFLNRSCLKLKGHAVLFAITSLRLIELNFNMIPLLKI